METTLMHDKKKKIVEFCAEKGIFLNKESVDLLGKQEKWENVLEEIKDQVITAEKIKQVLAMRESKLSNVKAAAKEL